MDISLQLSMFCGYPFGYPWISMDIHALTCYGSSIQGSVTSFCGFFVRRYRERSKELSHRFRLDPIPSLEKAVYYTEQLMKLGSFKHLQPRSVNLYWFQYLLLDVLAVIAIAVYISYKIIRFICSAFLRCCRKPSKPKKD